MIKAEIKIIDTEKPEYKTYVLDPSEITKGGGDGFERTTYKFCFEYVTLKTCPVIKEEVEEQE